MYNIFTIYMVWLLVDVVMVVSPPLIEMVNSFEFK